ncbi:hypothetical protein PIB30_041757, partial [Stylosanthes scabra]|nr:hypothetical protein [Stylosanthes scabra]
MSQSNVPRVIKQPVTQLVEEDVQPSTSKITRMETEQVNIATLIHDPKKRPQIWDYPINQRDEIRTAYMM